MTEGMEDGRKGRQMGELTDELQAKAREPGPAMAVVSFRALLCPWPVTSEVPHSLLAEGLGHSCLRQAI